jgi:Zn-dependent protease with chaperone function
VPMTSTSRALLPAETSSGARSGRPGSPAAVAAGRMFGATLALGLLAALSAGVALMRVVESWHLGSASSSRTISIAGQRLSYPAANVGAVVVVVLAALGLAMSAATMLRLGRELLRDRRFRERLHRAARRQIHGAWILEDDRPQAFCAGLLRPRVYVSTGALELLDERALAAVLAHERHHARNRDPLRLACGRAFAAGMLLVPTLRRLVQRQHALAEISADDAARAEGVERGALASAMLSFSEAAGSEPVGVDPQRIDNLLGEPPQWGFPLLLCLLTGIVLVAMLALAVLAGRVASGSATLALPFLSAQPCVVVLALVPAAALAVAAGRLRERRARTPVQV